MSAVYLPPHVFFCTRGDAVVFLDLRADQYSKIEGVPATVFAKTIRQLGETEDVGRMGGAATLAKEVQELIAAGLLTTESAGSKRARPTETELPGAVLLEAPSELAGTLRFQDIAAFFGCCLRAWIRLRFCTLYNTVCALRKMKAGSVVTVPPDPARLHELVYAFRTLRSLFPKGYLCLFDSLALYLFLARHGIFPTWVFAVRFDPWGAHCWLQVHDLLLNEDLEEAEDYTPVMAV
jgi:Transglutaminase-like superfamily